MATKTIKLKYTTVERFLKDYGQLKNGTLTLPVKSPLPLKSTISLKVSIPDIEPLLTLKGTVIKTFAPPVPGTACPPKTNVMRISFNGGSQDAIGNFDKILCRHEQYRADTAKLAQDVRGHLRSYIDRILQVKTTGEAVALLKLFQRILPDLIQRADWPIVLYLTRAVDQAAKTTVFFAAASGLPANPLEFAFKDRGDEIVKAYATADACQRRIINEIAGRLDASGIEIMARALSACPDGRVRKAIMSALVKKGDLAKNWMLAVLDAPGQKWYLKRTALTLLRYVGKKEEEIDRARKLVSHGHPRVREEALNVLIALQAVGAEELIIAALNDSADNVRRRAMGCLSRLSPISKSVMKLFLTKISATAPPRKKEAAIHYLKIAHLIKALGAAIDIARRAEAETIILNLVRKLSHHNKGLFRRLKKPIGPDQSDVLSAAIATLGKIGTDKSESFLEKLAGSKSPQAESAQAAANHIRLRCIALLSNAPADAGMPAMAWARGPWAATETLAAGSQG